MSKSELIKFKGGDYVVGLNWESVYGKNKSVIRTKIKEIIHKKKFDGFGVKIDPAKSQSQNSSEKTPLQIGFSEKKYKGEPSLAKIFAAKDEFKNSLVLLKLDDVGSDNEQRFWSCSITETGLIEGGFDEIHNLESFMDNINNHLAVIDDENLKIYLPKDEEDTFSELIDFEDFNVISFSPELILSEYGKDVEIDLIYNASAETLKQLGVLALTGSLLTCGYFFVYMENDLYSSILEQEVSSPFHMKLSKYNKFVKGQDKELNTTSVLTAKKELLEIHNVAYNKEDIINYFNQLFNDFPIYLVEWQLNNIEYVNNGQEFFRLSYQRIPNSFGYKDEFESEIKDILKNKNYKKYNFGYPNTSGDVIFINISFKDKKELNLSSDNGKREVQENIISIEKEIKKIKSEIETLESQAMDLSFFDKRFGSALSDLRNEIEDQVLKGNKIIEKMTKEREKLKQEDIRINEAIISGSRSQMLSMIQQHSYYAWKDSPRGIQYPKITTKGKDQEVVVPYAQSYEFTVNPGSNIDVIGMNGLQNILLSDKLLNKPFIRIKEVTFKLENDVWSIKGESYEKI